MYIPNLNPRFLQYMWVTKGYNCKNNFEGHDHEESCDLRLDTTSETSETSLL